MFKSILSYFFVFFILLNFSQSLQAKEIISSGSDDYRIMEVLGSGAFGKVLAVKNSQGNYFALKMIKQDNKWPHSLYLSAQREFERGQLLQHARIIKSYEFFIDPTSESHCIVLEYVNGQTLFKQIKQKKFSKQTASKIAIQFLNALKYAASLHLYHLDLHGNNIMITKHHNIKIIDLASFTSWDEILTYFWSEQTKKEDQDNTSIQTLLPSTHASDQRLKQKLEQFCERNPISILQNQFQEINYLSEPDIYRPFIMYYMSDVFREVIQILKLGKFKREEIQTIKKKLNAEIIGFFKVEQGKLIIDNLPHLFDRWKKHLSHSIGQAAFYENSEDQGDS